jgi:hypothetical protein
MQAACALRSVVNSTLLRVVFDVLCLGLRRDAQEPLRLVLVEIQ